MKSLTEDDADPSICLLSKKELQQKDFVVEALRKVGLFYKFPKSGSKDAIMLL